MEPVTVKTKKESPSGGEKLLRLLASGTTGPNDANKPSDTQALNNMPLNFAQGKHFKIITMLTFLHILV